MRLYMSAIIAVSALLLTGTVLSANSVSVSLRAAGPVNDGSYYVLPYQLTVEGVDYNADCYDFFDWIQLNETWQANELTLNQAATYGQFSGDNNALTGYKEIVWLSAQPATTEQEQIDLQHAMWNIFDPAANFAVSTTLENSLAAAVGSGFNGLDFDNDVFLEAVPETGGQAFVLYMPGGGGGQNTSSSPEPGGMITGLIGLGLIAISRIHGTGGFI